MKKFLIEKYKNIIVLPTFENFKKDFLKESEISDLDILLKDRTRFFELWDTAWKKVGKNPSHYIAEITGEDENELKEDTGFLLDILQNFFFEENNYKNSLTIIQQKNLYKFLSDNTKNITSKNINKFLLAKDKDNRLDATPEDQINFLLDKFSSMDLPGLEIIVLRRVMFGGMDCACYLLFDIKILQTKTIRGGKADYDVVFEKGSSDKILELITEINNGILEPNLLIGNIKIHKWCITDIKNDDNLDISSYKIGLRLWFKKLPYKSPLNSIFAVNKKFEEINYNFDVNINQIRREELEKLGLENYDN